MRHLSKYIAVISLLILSASCSDNNKSIENNTYRNLNETQEIISVTTAKAKNTDFALHLSSPGKLRASVIADICMPENSVIKGLLCRNGQAIKEGDIIAVLDTTQAQRSLRIAQLEYDRTYIEFCDKIIGQGYNPDNMTDVPNSIKNLCEVSCGLAKARENLRISHENIERCNIKSPLSGLVSGLSARTGEWMTMNERLCRIISPSAYFVEFYLLETEIPHIHIGTPVSIRPVGIDMNITGSINSIDSSVGENGMIKVSASSNISGISLADGTDVMVAAKPFAEKIIALPKSAVVYRSGKPIVFTVSKDSLSKWNNVTTGAENGDSIAITSGIEENDIVIINNNDNLTNNAPVKY